MQKKYMFMSGLAVLAAVVFLILLLQKNPTQTTNQSKKEQYVAIGDSVAAGVGLSTASDSSACDRTEESYPKLLANKGQFTLIDLACSGASIGNGVIGSQQVNGASLVPQIDGLSDGAKLVTVTVGANDIGWTQLLAKCYTADCGTTSDTSLLTQKLAQLKVDFDAMLTRITKQHPAMTLVTGYYQLFPASKQQCAQAVTPSDSSMRWIHDQQQRFTEELKTIVEAHTNMRFVPIDFTGHELCSADSWVQGLNDKAPFHPNEQGQKAIADALFPAIK